MTRAYVHDGCAIGVEADEDDHEWLAEFLSPAFAFVPAAPDAPEAMHARVQFVPGGPPHGPFDLRPIAFALDSQALRLPGRVRDGRTELHDAVGRVTYDVDDGGRAARVMYYGDRLDGRARLMRVIREYAHNHSIGSGGVMIHGAAVVLDGRGVLIAGEKRAGKTTMLLRMLEQRDVAFLSNDRVLVRAGSPPVAAAVPSVIAIREGSRALLGGMAARLAGCGDFREHRSARARRGPRSPMIWEDAWHVSGAQLAEATGCAAHATAPVAALLCLSSDPAPEAVRRLSARDAAEAIRRSVLGRQTGRCCSDVFTTADAAPALADVAARAGVLLSTVPCFAGRFRLDALREQLGAGGWSRPGDVQ